MPRFVKLPLDPSLPLLRRLQTNIYQSSSSLRGIRNRQRSLYKCFQLKILILILLLKPICITQLSDFDKQKSPFSYLWIQGIVQNLKPEFSRFLNTKSRNERTFDLPHLRVFLLAIIHVLSYLPIHLRLVNSQIWEARTLPSYRYFLTHLKSKIRIGNHNSLQISRIKIIFTQRFKSWIMHYLWLPKSVILDWYTSELAHLNPDQVELYLSGFTFRTLCRIHTLCYLLLVVEEKWKLNCFYCHGHLYWLNSSTKKSNRLSNQFNQIQWFHSNTAKPLCLMEGFHLFGWWIQKPHYSLLITKIGVSTLQAHKIEIIQFLQSAGTYPIDRVIRILNQKIKKWRSFYVSECTDRQIAHQLNRYLFWRIFYFLRRRHKTKGLNWLVTKYYQKIPSTQNWILHINDIWLLSYSEMNQELK